MKLKTELKNKFATRRFQKLWEFLFKLSIKLLNIGNGSEPESSGEIATIKWLISNNNINNNSVIFDVGANIGNYTNSIKTLIPNSNIFCFEPSTITFKKLSENLKNQPNVKLFNLGVSDSNDEATLYSDSDCSGLASLYKRQLKHVGIELSNTETIKLTTLDEFCKQQNIDHIDFLKIDIEGNELSALRGAKNLITDGKIYAIQIEFGGCNIDSHTNFLDFWTMLSEKYNVYRIVMDGPYPIREYNTVTEIYSTTNYIFVKK